MPNDTTRRHLRWHRYRAHGLYRRGLHFGYRLVRRDEATWRDIRGLFFATRRHTYWLTVEDR